MKRRKAIFAYAMIILAGSSLTTYGDTIVIDGLEWNYYLYYDEVQIVGLNEGIPAYTPAVPVDASGDITIPAYIEGLPVKKIRNGAFANCVNITSISIPDTVIKIDSGAFEGCADELFDKTTIDGVVMVDGWVVGYQEGIVGHLDLTGVREKLTSHVSSLTSYPYVLCLMSNVLPLCLTAPLTCESRLPLNVAKAYLPRRARF